MTPEEEHDEWNSFHLGADRMTNKGLMWSIRHWAEDYGKIPDQEYYDQLVTEARTRKQLVPLLVSLRLKGKIP